MSTRLELIRETEEKTRDGRGGSRRRIGGSCAHVTNTGSAGHKSAVWNGRPLNGPSMSGPVRAEQEQRVAGCASRALILLHPES